VERPSNQTTLPSVQYLTQYQYAKAHAELTHRPLAAPVSLWIDYDTIFKDYK
jgi:hypothetical protein